MIVLSLRGNLHKTYENKKSAGSHHTLLRSGPTSNELSDACA